jgi:membrane fusion protein (multidrug efflux system)
MKAKSKPRYRRLRSVFILLLILFLLALSYWYLFDRPTISSDDAYVNGNIIPVQALVPGIVVKVNADNSMPVHANQILIEQEQNLIHEQMENSKSALGQAVRQTRGQFAQVDQFGSQIESLQAQRIKLVDDLERYKKVEALGAVSTKVVADAQFDIDILDKQIKATRASLAIATALVANTTPQTNPLVMQKRADFISSYIQFKRSTITAPVDGYIANRSVQAGQQIAAGQLLMNIIPLNDLWIVANIKETDMARVRTGEQVQVNAHSYGNDVVYHGEVLGIEPAGGSTFSMFPPDNSTGNYIHIVERVPVRISLRHDDLIKYPLRPGMSVSVDINTANFGQKAVLQSNVAAASASYSTKIYEKEMNEANTIADSVIKAN